MARRHSPARSPSARCRRRLDFEEGRAEPRDAPLLRALPPAAAVRPQGVASRHAIAALPNGAVACASGGTVVEVGGFGPQAVRCTGRSRAIACVALSPCSRFLAAGEAAGSGRSPQVLVFDRESDDGPRLLKGHGQGVRLVAWCPQGFYFVSVGDVETDGGDHLIHLWSWPEGERLHSVTSSRSVVDFAFAPDAFAFVTLSSASAKQWSITQPDVRGATGGTSLAQLSGKSLAVELPGITHARDGRRRSNEDSFVSATWGANMVLYLATKRGLLCVMRHEHFDWMDVGQRVNAIVWSEQLCNAKPSAGVLVCALTAGTVQAFDAESLQLLASFSAALGAPEAIGVSCDIGGGALWALRADCSFARWQTFGGDPDFALPGPLHGIREAQGVPDAVDPQIVTSTDRAVQLWASTSQDFQLIARAEPGTQRTPEITALACSAYAVATGHRGGEINLLALPSLALLEFSPERHSGDVLALCFFAMQGLGAPLLLASASRDRSVMLFRLDLCSGNTSTDVSKAYHVMTLPGHSAAVQSVAIARGVEVSDVRLAACTADKQLVIRDVEVGQNNVSVRRTFKQACRGTRFVGLCAHPTRPKFFAVSGDRRVLQLDAAGKVRHAVRLGSDNGELVGPLRISSDGRILAVGFVAAPPSAEQSSGMLLLEASCEGVRAVARLAGHSDPASGIAFFGGSRLVLGCWQDGSMLVWQPPADVSAAGGSRPTALAVTAASPRPRSKVRAPVEAVVQRPGSPAARERSPDAMFERMMASSPKPPKWAEQTSDCCIVEDDEPDVSRGTLLGKWARGSAVGAQVRSASDLFAVLREDGGGSVEGSRISLAQEEAPVPVPQSAKGQQVHVCSAHVRESSVGPTSTQRERAPFDIEQHLHDDGTRRLSPSGGHSGSSTPLRPLPPVPNFPPPATQQLEHESRISGIVKGLQQQEDGQVLAAVAAALLGSRAPSPPVTSRYDVENTPPMQPRQLAQLAELAQLSQPAQAPPTARVVGAACYPRQAQRAERLRANAQRLHSEAMGALPPGTEAAEEVAMLLGRVDSLLRLDSGMHP